MNGKACFDDYIYAYRFQVLTGLRPGELIGLKWSDIDDFVVHVKRAINRDGEITKGKNENALRDFYLNDMTRGILKDQKRLLNLEILSLILFLNLEGIMMMLSLIC